jgi:hypothetical protein
MTPLGWIAGLYEDVVGERRRRAVISFGQVDCNADRNEGGAREHGRKMSAIVKHPLMWLYFFLFGLFPAFLFVRTTDWYKEVIDPEAYWTDKVEWRAELLKTYIADARKCAGELERLNTPRARQLWTEQKALEGISETEALADYRSYVENAEFACQFSREIIPGAARDVEEAKDALARARRKNK